MYPSLCTAFLMLLTAAIMSAVFGAYTFISFRLSIFRFDWPMSWFLIVNASFLAIGLVAPFIILSLLLWCVCSTRKRAIAFKTVYVMLIMLTIVALAACMVAAILLIYGATDETSFFSRELEAVWVAEVRQSNSTLACRVQYQLGCRGFEEGDCSSSSPTVNASRCGVNCRPQDTDGKAKFDNVIYPGCRASIASFFITWNAVLLTGASIACVLTLFTLFVVCGISFETEGK